VLHRRRRPLREQQHRAWLERPPRRRPRRIFGHHRLDLRIPTGILAAVTVLVGVYGEGIHSELLGGEGLPQNRVVLATSDGCEKARIAFCYDGDTCDALIGGRQESVRLAGFDTPELNHNAQCAKEQRLARAARDRLRVLIAHARDREFCPDGWSFDRDRYGRVLAVLELDGRDVASILIEEGHAVPYSGGRKAHDWCL
jgi:micrococcal nuclease